jgi:hypothetical protein
MPYYKDVYALSWSKQRETWTRIWNQHSEKSSDQAAREMNYSTPAGLEFLYTRLVGGRTHEMIFGEMDGGARRRVWLYNVVDK